jgi:hypothetical protein
VEPLPGGVAPAEPVPVELLPDGPALAEPLTEGGAPAGLLAAPAGGAAEGSGALVQPPSTRQSAEVTAAVARQWCRRERPSLVGIDVLSVVPLVLTRSLTPRSAVLDPPYVGWL